MKFPERYRCDHPLGFEHKEGDPFGCFMVPSINNSNHMIFVQANEDLNNDGWEHLSASLRNRCPTWEEMCQLKNLFWDEHETVVQFHPPKSDYVNNAKNCLHLWKYVRGEIPRPPSILVGLKGLNENT